MHRLVIIFLLLSFAQAQPNPDELMRQAIDADLRNDEKTPQYTYQNQRTVRAFAKDGKETGSATWVWDVTPLKTYDKVDRKLIASNGEKVSLNLDYQLAVGPGMIPGLFDLSILREEPLLGRNSWVILGTSSPGAKPKDDNERELLNYRFTIWIDQEDGFPAQFKMEVLTDKSRLQRGSSLEWSSARNSEGVWLLQRQRFQYVSKGAFRSSRGEILDEYLNYRRFDVRSRIIGVEQ